MSHVTPRRVHGSVWVQARLPRHCTAAPRPALLSGSSPRPLGLHYKPQGRGSSGLPLLIATPCGYSGSRTHPGQAAPGFLPSRTQVKGRCWWLPVSLHFIMCSGKVEMLVSTSLPGTATNSTQDVVLGLSAQRTLCSTEPDLPPQLSDQELHFQET